MKLKIFTSRFCKKTLTWTWLQVVDLIIASDVSQKQKKTGADILRIETVTPYTGSYNKVVDQGQDEVNRGYCPEIKPLAAGLDQYDRVILGSPVWWYTFAPAMHTFLKSQNWKGKTVYPFATNGGWIGHTFKDFTNACQGADVRPGMNIRFDESTPL